MGKRRDSSLKPTPFRGQLSHQRGASPPQAAPVSSQRSLVPSSSHGQGPVFPWVLPPRIALPHLPPLLWSSFLSRGSCCLEPGPLALICSVMSLSRTRLWEMLHAPLLLCSLLWGELCLAATEHRTSREAGEARGSGQGVEGGEGGAVSVLGLVRRAQWVKGYFKAGIAVCPLSLSGKRVVTT